MSEGLQGLEFLKKNEIKDMQCNMERPFAFISYSHFEHDSQIVMNVFKKLNAKGYNLWIDIANIPHDANSWETAADTALESHNCKLAIYFRSESSMKKDTIATELQDIDDYDHLGRKKIITVDIWKKSDLTAAFCRKDILNHGNKDEKMNCKKICNIVSTNNSAIRLSSDAENDIDKLVNEIADELKSKEVEPWKNDSDYPKPIPEPTPEPLPTQSLYYKGAVGKLDGLGGIVIFKNSKISKEIATSCPEAARKKRQEELNRNMLLDNSGYYVLQEDVYFKSLSGAACFVSGNSVNGNLAWKSEQPSIKELGTKKNMDSDKGISSKINQICMVIQKVKEQEKPIYDYSKVLQKAYENVADELKIGKSSVVDKCQRQLNLSADEFKRYVKEHFESQNDTLYKIVFNAAKSQEEKELVNCTFEKNN